MIEALLELVHQTVTSPWLYAVVAGMATLDMIVPVIPGETAGVAAAAGAFIGDHLTYTLGRGAGGPVTRRLRTHPASKRARAVTWARTLLAHRGASVLIASRCLPGVRTATTLTMGLVGYRLRSFTLADTAAAPLWATGCALVGYTGGALFPTRPLLGLLTGLTLATTIILTAELAHRRRTIKHTHRADHPVLCRRRTSTELIREALPGELTASIGPTPARQPPGESGELALEITGRGAVTWWAPDQAVTPGAAGRSRAVWA